LNADLNQPGLTSPESQNDSGLKSNLKSDLTLDSESNILDKQSLEENNTGNADFGLPYNFAKRHGVLINEIQEDVIDIRHRPHISTLTVIELKRYLPGSIELHQISVDEFDQLLQDKYESQSNDAMDMIEGLGGEFDLNTIAEELAEPEDLLESQDDAPIIRLINALLTQAIKEDASDIHIEPFETRMTVRMRVDGVLREVLQPQRALAPLITSRIKIMAKLDIAEKRLPQDGRISLRIAGRSVDVRVSTLPSGHGERIVMRLLDALIGQTGRSSGFIPAWYVNGKSGNNGSSHSQTAWYRFSYRANRLR